jgi:vacuolar protein sorting-associated protein 13A/C
MALTVNRLGMSLVRMGNNFENVRFLDDVDLTFSLDSRSNSSQQMTSIEITSKPIVFRASYRDINLITTIANKAIALSSNTESGSSELDLVGATATHDRKSRSNKAGTKSPQPTGKARVVTSKEQVQLARLFLNRALTFVLS